MLANRLEHKLINHVKVYWGSLQASLEEISDLRHYLSAEEIEKASRFVTEELTHRYIVAHGLLRELLAQALKVKPQDLQFVVNEYGKPCLLDHSLHFNLSHSNDRVLIGLSEKAPVGVDVEYLNRQNMDYLSIAKRYFHHHEYEKLQRLTPEEQPLGFYRAWTGKEALLKALGVGIANYLADCEVTLMPEEAAEVIEIPKKKQGQAWLLASFTLDADYLAAVCYQV